MKRQLCVCALAALLLVPDWASACWPRWGAPAYYHPAPVYYAPPPPVYCQPVYVPPCVPVMPPPMLPPRVEMGPSRPSTAVAPRTPPVDPVRPASGVGAPKAAKPDPAPAPLPPEAKIPATAVPRVAPEPKAAPAEAPKLPPLEFPKLDFPKVDAAPKVSPIELPTGDKEKLPPLELPKPDATPKLPALDLPKVDAGVKPPALELPGVPAIPVPAPAPDTLPPLTLPPDTPVAKPTESKSSPLAAGEPKVSVFPASGSAATARGLRTVGFYNHTARDLALTIEGKAVTLPAKSYISAQLPPTFTWKHGDRAAATETVPADASGVDVLFRE